MSNYYCLVKYWKTECLMRSPYYKYMQLRNYRNRIFEKQM